MIHRSSKLGPRSTTQSYQCAVSCRGYINEKVHLCFGACSDAGSISPYPPCSHEGAQCLPQTFRAFLSRTEYLREEISGRETRFRNLLPRCVASCTGSPHPTTACICVCLSR